MPDFCTIFAITLSSVMVCVCCCINLTQKNNVYKCCKKNCCGDCRPSDVSNIHNPIIVINEQPRLINNIDELNDLPKYDDVILCNEVGVIDEMPPPDYIP